MSATPEDPKPSAAASGSAPTTASRVEGWLVAIQGRCYGPYLPDELASFLAPEHWVFHVSTGDWMRAADVETLPATLRKRVTETIDWFYRTRDGKEHGPFARDAMIRMAKETTLPADAEVWQASWKRRIPLLETPLAREAGLDLTRPRRFTRQSADAPPQKREVSREELSPKAAAAIVVAALVLISAGVYLNYSWSRTPSTVRACGAWSGGCLEDKVSRCVCAMDASKCGCQGSTRGSCGMGPCLDFAKSMGMKIEAK